MWQEKPQFVAEMASYFKTNSQINGADGNQWSEGALRYCTSEEWLILPIMKTPAPRNEDIFVIEVLTRLMLGRVLNPGEEYLVFNLFIKSEVWLQQSQMCASSSPVPVGLWLRLLGDNCGGSSSACAVPHRAGGALWCGSLPPRVCSSSSAAVKKSRIDYRCC